MSLRLDPRLEADTTFITDWPVNRVLLMNDANYPWLVLVPRLEGLRDFHDVPSEDEAVFQDEINRAARALKQITGAAKMNTAALGNMVPQLHVHVIARFESDVAWPDPVWGKHPAVPYGDGEAEALIEKFLAVAGK